MKKFFLAIFLMSVGFINAQQDLFVSGQVLDSVTQKGLESCAVGFFNQKKELVSGVSTDEKGYFEIALRPGKYNLVLDYIGYTKKNIPVFIRKNNQFLGTFSLAPDQNLLKSVEIKASNKAYKLDKDVYTVSHKMKIAAANANDVLDRIQGVNYDRYNNQIKVDGQTNVKILVDGLEKAPDYIQNLNPERLKKVEIIRDPSGKYALDGYTAVINIILKRNYTGLELNLSHQSLFDLDVKDRAYFFPVSYSNAGLTYTYNNINVYGQYNLYSNKFNFPTETIYKYKDGKEIQKLSNDSHNLVKDALGDRLTLGMDYYLNPRNILSFESGFTNIFAQKDRTNLQYLVKEIMPNTPILQYDQSDLIEEESNSNYQSVFYVGKFNEKNQLNIDATLSHYQNQSDNQFLIDQNTDREEHLFDKKNSFRLNADYSHQINDKNSMEIGYGFYTQKNNNELTTKANNTTSQQNFELKDQRHKAFGYFAHKFNSKWSSKIGLAGEISRPSAFGAKTTYMIYQPYLDIQHVLSKNLSLKFKYRTESDYPGLSQANPNSVYVDPQTIRKGNPNLAPAVTHKLALRINFFGGKLFAEPYYHFSKNYIGQVASLRNDGIIEQTYENIGEYKHYGLRGNLAVPFSKKIFWQTNFDLYRSSISYQNQTNAFNDYNLDSNLLYIDGKKGIFTGFIYQRGMNRYITAQGYHKSNNDYLGFLVKKTLLKRKLNLMLLYMLPIDTGVDYIQEEYAKTLDYESMTRHDITLLKNMVVFRLNYRFSKGKATRKTEKNIENDSPKTKKKGLF